MKQFTVLDFSFRCRSGNNIPVRIMEGTEIIWQGKSLSGVATHAPLYVLDSKVKYITLSPNLVTIDVKPATFSTKRP